MHRKKGKKVVMILGCSTMQYPAIKIAKKSGWIVIGLDANRDAEFVKSVDHFENVDISDKERVLSVAKKYNQLLGLDSVFTAGTDFSTTVSFVCEKLNLTSVSYQATLNASNKFLMRQTLEKGGVNCPKYFEFDADNLDQINTLKFPVVIKPVDSMGARGIKKIYNIEDLKIGVADSMKFSRLKKIIIEEYVDGIEFSIDALVVNNDIHICGVADRVIKFPPFFIETGHNMPTTQNSAVVDSVVEEFKKGVKVLGINNGAAKGDVKYSSDGKPFIIEIAARLSGGYMSGWTYPYSSGSNLTLAALKISLGEKVKLPLKDRGFFSIERAFFSIPGVVKKVENVGLAKKVNNVKNIFVRSKKGDVVDFPKNNVEKCGNVISLSKNFDNAIFSAEEGVRKILVRLEPLNSTTENFLIFKNNREKAFKNIDFLSEFCFNINKIEKKSKELLIGIEEKPLLIKSDSVDWFGMEFNAGINYLISTGHYVKKKECDVILDELFYRVYIKGSIQAAIWLADSLKMAYRRGNLDEILAGWEKT